MGDTSTYGACITPTRQIQGMRTCETEVDVLHLDSPQLISELVPDEAVGFLDQLLRLLAVVDEELLSRLPLILTNLAITRFVHAVLNVRLLVVYRSSTH